MASREISQCGEQGACNPPPDAPKLCINNCGFFGTPENNFLCSFCFKQYLKASSMEEVTRSLEANCRISDPQDDAPRIELSSTSSPCKQPSLACAGPSLICDSEPDPTLSSSSSSTPPTKPNRCFSCRKRVGLLGFKCRCGNVFCSSHRHSDQHDCSFDYKTTARDVISNANPVVKADKLNKI